MHQNLINYSQCWEDPALLREALAAESTDRILSITSGGDNTLALLLSGAKVDAIDLNQAQNDLLNIKKRAAELHSYDEYLALAGVNTPGKGFIHCGRFEKFTSSFARHILPRIHGHKSILDLLSAKDLAEQIAVYRTQWDTKIWRIAFGMAVKLAMTRRYRGAHSSQVSIHTLAYRLEHLMRSVPIQSNYFVHYSLKGQYGNALPPYLEEKNFSMLKKAQNLSITTADLYTHLCSQPDKTYSKFNLSDVFETLSEKEARALWKEIVRTAKPNARIAYWTLCKDFTPTGVEPLHIKTLDRVFFYDSFHAYRIT